MTRRRTCPHTTNFFVRTLCNTFVRLPAKSALHRRQMKMLSWGSLEFAKRDGSPDADIARMGLAASCSVAEVLDGSITMPCATFRCNRNPLFDLSSLWFKDLAAHMEESSVSGMLIDIQVLAERCNPERCRRKDETWVPGLSANHNDGMQRTEWPQQAC